MLYGYHPLVVSLRSCHLTMGLTNISENIDVFTPYKYAYHGYWVNDPTRINPRFGSSDDLKALSKAVHDRGM
jgi:alpha-amylase